MTNYREILRLDSRGISQRSIAASCQCSRNTVARVLARAREETITWPLQTDLTDGELGKILFPDTSEPSSKRHLPELEYVCIFRQHADRQSGDMRTVFRRHADSIPVTCGHL